jgi:hypothetical protein
MENFNKLTSAETERLAILAEECAEVIQIIGKILRHGYESHHPLNEYQSNRDLLTIELADVGLAMDLILEDDLNRDNYEDACVKKFKTKNKYWHHQDKDAERTAMLDDIDEAKEMTEYYNVN